jgi:DNA-binding response OmpR family regulator
MADSFPSILCVDDDPEVLDRLKEHFALQGFIVLTATNGVEACLQVKRWAPKAVILDLLIPRLGGIGTLRRIREFSPRLPVIFVGDTVEALDLVREAGLEVAGVFAKPLDLEKISSALAAANVTPPGQLAADSSATVAPRQAPRARILLVDDQQLFRQMLAEHLNEEGFEVFEAGSGEEALLEFPRARPQVVLLDMLMPGMSGLEALREIKAVSPETCVVMVTAVEDLDTARGALGAGASDYVTKPFSLQYLNSVLAMHMSERDGHPSHQSGSPA